MGSYINLTTGEIFDNYNHASEFNGYIIECEKDSIKYYYDKKNGERIDPTKYMVSSKGIMVYQDTVSNLYGFRNKLTGEVVIKPKYQKLMHNIWISDMKIAVDSINPDIKMKKKLD